ncbi:hypothetical protein C5167_050347 [Papaver somniferum]|uniref:Uncharacterized protein n=1 Tax=Papaver somniferum TaxID=3469 RepID=A0A4Y7KRU3_PAPSO|nr:hypothetical protein C5167_050347 [Papaver somniferum]
MEILLKTSIQTMYQKVVEDQMKKVMMMMMSLKEMMEMAMGPRLHLAVSILRTMRRKIGTDVMARMTGDLLKNIRENKLGWLRMELNYDQQVFLSDGIVKSFHEAVEVVMNSYGCKLLVMKVLISVVIDAEG